MPREANYEAVPRVTVTDPQAAAVGVVDDAFSAPMRLPDVAGADGYLTLLSGEIATARVAS